MSLAAAQVKAIGSVEYKVLPLPAMTSLRVLTRVLKMTAPAFADVSSLRDAASAMGAFLSAGIMELDEAVIVYFGDGATSQGDVSESMVFAASYQAPLVFFLQNNHWAISVPVTRQSRTPLYQRPAGFGIRLDAGTAYSGAVITRFYDPQSGVITLDGIPFLFAVDRLSKTESFGRADATIAGRSITAALSRPFARELTRTNTSAANAQQLAAAALDLTGFALDWGIVDWLVPAGAWSHTSTPLAAVQAIAEAAGAYVQSARNAAAVLVRHPYPAMQGGSIAAGPWNWDAADPDVVLAPDAVVTTAIERQDGADINAVYVCGTNAGVRALVKRTGTAGDKLSAMVTDPLITAEAAARQRGTAIVGAAGAKQLVTIELPLLTAEIAPGVLDVGQLIEIDAAQPWRGMVRAVNVSAQFGRQVRQTATVERHLNE